MSVVWNEFKTFNMNSMRTNMRFVPQNFDQIYEYLNSILFTKQNVDFDKVEARWKELKNVKVSLANKYWTSEVRNKADELSE